MIEILISYEAASKLLRYDPDFGLLFWRQQRGRAILGMTAGCYGKGRYRVLKICGKNYLAHRVAWLLFYGQWPDGQIDHINGNCKDNRIENLRLATAAENLQNQRAFRPKNKSCGILGVSYEKARKKYSAQIHLAGKKYFLGRFTTAAQAHQAYVVAKRILHPFGNL